MTILLIFKVIQQFVVLKEAKARTEQFEETSDVLTLFLNNTPYKWGIWFPDDQTLKCPQAFGRIFGLSNETTLDLNDFLSKFDDESQTTLREHFLNWKKNTEQTGAAEGFELLARLGNDKKMVALQGQILTQKGKKVFVLWAKTAFNSMKVLEKTKDLEEKFKSILDHVPFPLWSRDREGKLSYCNKAYGDLLQLPTREVLKQSLSIGQDDDWIQIASPAGTPDRVTTLKKSFPIEDQKKMMRLVETTFKSSGQTIGYGVDLSAVEKLEFNLKACVDGFYRAMDQLDVGVISYGGDKRVNYCNKTYAEWFKIDSDWIASRPSMIEVLNHLRDHRMLVETGNLQSYMHEWLKSFSTVKEPVQRMLHLPDERAIRLTTMPSPLGEGLLLFFEDMTDALSLERQTNTQAAVQKATLNALTEGIAVFSGNNRLKAANRAFKDIWQLTDEDLSTTPHISEIIEKIKEFFDYGTNWTSYKQDLTDTLTARIEQSGKLHRTDGSTLSYCYVPLPDGAHLLSYTDITDRQKVENALQEKKNILETTELLKRDFLSTISLELKTPLNTILGFAEILSQRYLGDLTPAQLAHTKGIVASSKRLISYLSNMIDLAAIEAGQMKLSFQPINLERLLSGLKKWADTHEKQRPLKIVTHGTTNEFVGDERRLRQLLLQLVDNALKFTAPDEQVLVGYQTCESHIRIFVTDSGEGILTHDRDRIFKKFERTESHPQKGVGLGLALVKGLAELHKGTVYIKQNPTRGTTVVCELPLNLPASSQQALPDLEGLVA